tara:strand:+ start:444 stop:782 length:339 start_codon:yes stop_codon:yes gene_type:complete
MPCASLETIQKSVRIGLIIATASVYIAPVPPIGSAEAGARRTGGRVVEGARLERVYTGNRIEGSNPSLSAITSSQDHDFIHGFLSGIGWLHSGANVEAALSCSGFSTLPYLL